MKLFHTPSTCSLIPYIVLRELAVPFELVSVNLLHKKTDAGEDLFAINPKGKVPVLQLDDGQMLTETATIVQFLADQAPDKHLSFEPGTMERVRLQEWLNFLASDIHKSFAVFFVPEATDDYRRAIRERIASCYSLVDKHLADRAFLIGSRFTIADAYLFVVTHWASLRHIDLAPFPNLLAFQQRIASRPSVRDAMGIGG
jgi:glutathione S-transferase